MGSLCPRGFVQLYCPRTDAVCRNLAQEIKRKLTDNYVNVEICYDLSSVNTDKPALVLCIKTSRIGADVTHALEGITLSHLWAAVVLHSVDPQLSSPEPSFRILTDNSLYKSLGGMFDMRFCSNEKGTLNIYDCEMNTCAVKEIINFIA